MKIRFVAMAAVLAFVLGSQLPAFAGAEQGGAGVLGAEAAGRLVNFDVRGATPEDVSAELSRLAGVPVVWAPAQSGELLSLQVSNFALGDLLAELAQRGAVAVGPATGKGRSESGTGADRSQRISLQVREVDAATLSRMLTDILGTDVTFKHQDPRFAISLDVKDTSVGELIATLRQIGELTLPTSPR